MIPEGLVVQHKVTGEWLLVIDNSPLFRFNFDKIKVRRYNPKKNKYTTIVIDQRELKLLT